MSTEVTTVIDTSLPKIDKPFVFVYEPQLCDTLIDFFCQNNIFYGTYSGSFRVPNGAYHVTRSTLGNSPDFCSDGILEIAYQSQFKVGDKTYYTGKIVYQYKWQDDPCCFGVCHRVRIKAHELPKFVPVEHLMVKDVIPCVTAEVMSRVDETCTVTDEKSRLLENA